MENILDGRRLKQFLLLQYTTSVGIKATVLRGGPPREDGGRDAPARDPRNLPRSVHSGSREWPPPESETASMEGARMATGESDEEDILTF